MIRLAAPLWLALIGVGLLDAAAVRPRGELGEEPWIVATLAQPPSLVLDRQALSANLHQLSFFRSDLTNCIGPRGVTAPPIFPARRVETHDITRLQFALAGDAMHDLFVDRDARHRRERFELFSCNEVSQHRFISVSPFGMVFDITRNDVRERQHPTP